MFFDRILCVFFHAGCGALCVCVFVGYFAFFGRILCAFVPRGLWGTLHFFVGYFVFFGGILCAFGRSLVAAGALRARPARRAAWERRAGPAGGPWPSIRPAFSLLPRCAWAPRVPRLSCCPLLPLPAHRALSGGFRPGARATGFSCAVGCSPFRGVVVLERSPAKLKYEYCFLIYGKPVSESENSNLNDGNRLSFRFGRPEGRTWWAH